MQQTQTSLPARRTLTQYDGYVRSITTGPMLTKEYSRLVRLGEFVGDEYKAARSLIFGRAKVLGLTYSSTSKTFDQHRPQVSKPPVGAAVYLPAIGQNGLVKGYAGFDVVVVVPSGRTHHVAPEHCRLLTHSNT